MVEAQDGLEAGSMRGVPPPDLLPLLRQAVLIRRVEERLLELFTEGRINGTLHTCIGQEWSAAAVCAALGADDWVFSNHRGHGHFIARTGDVDGLIAEIMGKQSGVCGGYGGSQHLHAPGFYSNGILGGMVPVAAGAAFAAKYRGTGGISVVFLGDGALGEGLVYETLNLAAKWEVPLLLVVENNGIAQSTDCATTLAGTIAGRAAAFGVDWRTGATWEPEALVDIARDAVHHVRERSRPLLLEIRTYRLKAHSKGDDTRDAGVVGGFLASDPVQRFLASGTKLAAQLDSEARERIEVAVTKALEGADCVPPRSASPAAGVPRWAALVPPARQRIADACHEALACRLEDPRAMLVGEDIEGPYGGAFKITRDLSLRHPGRVRNTPISEAAITGFATGMALQGLRPIVEIMFGDFATLVFDQLQQHACKFRRMYGGGVDVPLVLRTPMGGRRGYGPTHSQSLEKHFLGVPNLRVLALNRLIPVADFYAAAFAQNDPVLLIENKVLYTRAGGEPVPGMVFEISGGDFPWVRVSLQGSAADVSIFCYGGMLEEAEAAVLELFDEYEIRAEILCPSQLAPFDERPLADSVARTARLLTCEEGPGFCALGAEAIACLARRGVTLRSVRRLACDEVIPSAFGAERELLPNARAIVAAVVEMLR
jgi:2-oxoisovalerate dehydrogenase E1 component